MGMFEAFMKMKDEEKAALVNSRLHQNARRYKKGEPEPLLKQTMDLVLNDAFPSKERHSSGIFSKLDQYAPRAQAIANSGWFENLITCTIVAIGLMIGVDTNQSLVCNRMENRLDDGGKEAVASCRAERPATVAIKIFSQTIFTAEIVVKVLAEGSEPMKYFVDAVEGSWNSLDFAVVLIGFIEMTPAKFIFEKFPVVILRLSRLVRVFRLAKAFPRLRSIVEALISGFAAVGWICVLIIAFNYILACAGILIFRDNDPFHFGSLGRAMFTMLRLETLDTWDQILYLAMFGCDKFPSYDFTNKNPNMKCKTPHAFGWVGAFMFVLVVLVGAFVLPTVLIGIVSIKFDEASRYADTLRGLRKDEGRILEEAKESIPGFFTVERLDTIRKLFDLLDADATLNLDDFQLASFYHYAFAKLYGVDLRADQCESLFHCMDRNTDGIIGFSEFVYFIAILKKIERRSRDSEMGIMELFGDGVRPMFMSVNRTKTDDDFIMWNTAMATTQRELVRMAWDGIFTALNGEEGSNLREKIENFFKKIDSDGSGELDKDELVSGLKVCGVELADDALNAFLMTADVNGDGNLDVDEFVATIENEFNERERARTEEMRRAARSLVDLHPSLAGIGCDVGSVEPTLRLRALQKSMKVPGLASVAALRFGSPPSHRESVEGSSGDPPSPASLSVGGASSSTTVHAAMRSPVAVVKRPQLSRTESETHMAEMRALFFSAH